MINYLLIHFCFTKFVYEIGKLMHKNQSSINKNNLLIKLNCKVVINFNSTLKNTKVDNYWKMLLRRHLLWKSLTKILFVLKKNPDLLRSQTVQTALQCLYWLLLYYFFKIRVSLWDSQYYTLILWIVFCSRALLNLA